MAVSYIRFEKANSSVPVANPLQPSNAVALTLTDIVNKELRQPDPAEHLLLFDILASG
jgi:hypothetical protein